MKTYTPIQTKALSAITCDRCQVSFTDNDVGWNEIQSIGFVAGYESIFGDGKTVSIDLCQICLKQTLGQYLHIGERESVPEDAINALCQSADGANTSTDDTIKTIEEPNRRSERMELAASDIQNLQGMLHRPGLPPVPIDALSPGKPDVGRSPGRIRYTLEELLANAPARPPVVEGWEALVPIGREFGTDSVRFTRVLKKAMSGLGNPMDAVQWLIAANPLLDGTPMTIALDSEEGCRNVLEALSEFGNEK